MKGDNIASPGCLKGLACGAVRALWRCLISAESSPSRGPNGTAKSYRSASITIATPLLNVFGCQHALVMLPVFQSTPLPSGETPQEDCWLRTSQVSKNTFVNRNNLTRCGSVSLNVRYWNQLRFRISGSRECVDLSLISGSLFS